MKLSEAVNLLRAAPLVASVQAPHGSPLDDPSIICRMTRCSLDEGVRVVRLEGVGNIRAVKAELDCPVIGLIKKDYSGSEVYITPTRVEVRALIESGCEIIALDGTSRARPGGDTLKDLIDLIHEEGRLALADIDHVESAKFARECGADLVSTTLSGYTRLVPATPGPDIDLVRECRTLDCPVLAEGRYSEGWQVQAALAAGAAAVVVGGAINDPIKTTRKFASATEPCGYSVGAVDIGGTWIRYAHFDVEGILTRCAFDPTPTTSDARLDWIADQCNTDQVHSVGISTGGTVDPQTLEVWEAKPIIPNHEGSSFAPLYQRGLKRVAALNDGLATAWAHALLPETAGKRIATLALGTGVGFGLVDRGRILMGQRGEYPRINDASAWDGRSFEDLLGGAALSKEPRPDQIRDANRAAEAAVELIEQLFYPECLVVCGGVGLSPWIEIEALRSPYGELAGLYGVAAILRNPPIL